ncbi:MAG: DUF4381 family protein, partial [Candidatus Eiseniibacteriota bacterium]
FAAAAAARLPLHAEAGPDGAPIGALVHYRGWVIVPSTEGVNWVTPRNAASFSWGAVHLTRSAGASGTDTARVDAEVQVFSLGRVAIPGIRFVLPDGSRLEHSLPVVFLDVRPTITPADSNARLRPLRGPLAAPWWERVPWRWVAAAVVVIALVIAVVVWRRRRKTVPPVVARGATGDPVAEALAELAALRGLELPRQQRFAEHAFQLTQILRRFLEHTAGGVKPGLTSDELVRWLSHQPGRIDVARLEALLRVWDRIKFARAPGSSEQAADAEAAVETWVRAHVSPAVREVA